MKKFRSHTTRAAHGRRSPRRTGFVRVLLAGGALLGLGTLFTWAAFTDVAFLNLGGPDGAIGSSSKFDIAVVSPAGKVEQADDEAGVIRQLEHAESYVPGRTLTNSVTVFNNSHTYLGKLRLTMETVGDGAVGKAPNITRFLRFSAVDVESGNVLFGDPQKPAQGVPLSAAQADVGYLLARGSQSLSDGATYTRGAKGSERVVQVYIHYLDAPETVDYNGGQAALRMRLDAQSE